MALFVDLVALSNGLHGSVQMDLVALFSWIGWLRHRGILKNEESATFFASAWRQFRKKDAYPTGITQNVKYLLSSQQGTSMLSNSEFIVMLNQSSNDREDLARLLNISEEQMGYITNAPTGSGLIKYGGSIVPFVNKMPKGLLYDLNTTKPGDRKVLQN